jgi:HlyD family secretion protein
MNPHVDLRQLAVSRESAPASVAPRRHIVSRYIVPGVVLAGFLALGGWAARDSLLPAHPVTVVPVLTTRAELQQSGVPLFQAAGWVEPRPTPTMVPALTEGTVDRLLVVEGQEVKADEPVATLVDADARLAVQAAEADLRHREAEADALLAKADADRLFLPFQIESAEARLKLARTEVESRKSAMSAVPTLTLSRAESELVTARTALEELNLRKSRVDREVVSLRRLRDHNSTPKAASESEDKATDNRTPPTEAEANMQVAMARIGQARVALAAARLRLERTTIRAPTAGRVLTLLARPGSRLMGMQPGGHAEANAVVSLYDPERLQIRADVRFEDLPGVVPGQPVKIETPAVRGGPLEGVVLFATSLADIQKNTLQVKVALKEPQPILKPEMLVQVTFLAAARPDPAGDSNRLRLLVPRQLVLSGEGGARVWVADQVAGSARYQTIKLGGTAGELVEVTEGLNPADKLIAGGRELLRDGQRIRVVGEETAATPTGETSPRPSRLPRNPEHKEKH